MSETPQAGVKFGRHVWVGLGVALACLVGLMLIRSGLDTAPEQSGEGKSMGRSAAATMIPAARPPIDLVVPAAVETATFGLG
jgi:hypothetical protein